MQYIGNQLKMICSKKGFQIGFLLVFCYAMFITARGAWLQQGKDVSELFHPAILTGLTSDVEYVWFFSRYFVFLVVLPSGFVFFQDKKTGMEYFQKSRMGNKNYYISKTIAIFLAGFIAITVPFLLELLVNVIIFPKGAIKHVTGWPTYSDVYIQQAERYLMGELFMNNIYLYFICHLLLVGVFAGCASVFVAGISRFPIKFKIFLFLPVYLTVYVLGSMSDKKLCAYLEYYFVSCDGTMGKSMPLFIGVMVFMFVAGIVSMAVTARKNEVG